MRMLLLNADPLVWIDHEPTGCRFQIKPLLPRDQERLLKRARKKNGDTDFIAFNGLAVDFAVVEWEGPGDTSGPLPATTENKIKLGEKFPDLARFIAEQARSATLFLEEEDAAKNG